MTRKKVIKILIIISVIIFLLGIIIGIGVSNEITERIPIENTNNEKFEDLLGLFAFVGARILGFAIICYTIFIDIMIWIIYGIVIFTKKIINKLNEKNMQV